MRFAFEVAGCVIAFALWVGLWIEIDELLEDIFGCSFAALTVGIAFAVPLGVMAYIYR